jgi:hypothetical protein
MKQKLIEKNSWWKTITNNMRFKIYTICLFVFFIQSLRFLYWSYIVPIKCLLSIFMSSKLEYINKWIYFDII